MQQLNRLQNELKVLSSTPSSSWAISEIFRDRDDAWIDVSHNLLWVRNRSQFLYLSEQVGCRQLLLVTPPSPSSTSSLEAFPAPLPLTPAGLDVESVLGADEILELIYFVASPADPLSRYLYRVNFKGTEIQRVTPEEDGSFIGTNSYSLSGDAKFAVHTFSNFDRPSVTKIIRLPEHVEVAALAFNDKLWANVKQIDCTPVEYFTVSIPSAGGDAVELDGWCLLPPNLDTSKKAACPVIFYVYGEPAAQIVRRQWGGKVGLWHRMLAQRGAAVVCVDNRGTPAPKGRAWRKAIYGQIGILASADQAAAAKAILAQRTYLDPARVAIWGWSGGGSMSLNALFRYPDLYKAAVAIAPVPDMRLYDTIYQERYMGLPTENPGGYAQGSPITFAHQMKDTQSLLLIHGTGDDNCHYQGTELLINELVKFNKPFQMLAYPNRSHSISEGLNTTRHLFEQVTRFFAANKLLEN